MEDNIKIYVREGIDLMLLAHERDVAGCCEIGNDNYGSADAGNFLNN
jgi:hypothetical protein